MIDKFKLKFSELDRSTSAAPPQPEQFEVLQHFLPQNSDHSTFDVLRGPQLFSLACKPLATT